MIYLFKKQATPQLKTRNLFSLNKENKAIKDIIIRHIKNFFEYIKLSVEEYYDKYDHT